MQINEKPQIQAGAEIGIVNKDNYTMQNPSFPPCFPQALTDLPHWVLWRLVTKDDAPKPAKVPYSAMTLAACDQTALGNLTMYEAALAAWEHAPKYFQGLGFSLQGGIVCVDLDDCLTEDGELSPWAQSILDQLPASFTEVSQSGRGLHWFGLGAMDGTRSKFTLADGHTVEMYQSKRFIALTGNRFQDAPLELVEAGAELNQLYTQLCAKGSQPPVTQVTEGPAIPVDLDDAQLIQKMFRSSKGKAIEALWHGDTSGHNDDDSSADLALLSHLAWWTNGDAHRMEGLFGQSMLAARDKWQRDDYRQRTIAKALEGFRGGYNPSLPPKSSVSHGKRLKTFTAAELMAKEFPPVKWVIPGLLPEGLTLLVGSPKIGKSWLCLDICRAVAYGANAITSSNAEQGKCLYLAMEDNERRIQDRMFILDMDKASNNLVMSVELVNRDSDGLTFINQWLEDNPDARLVIVDTFQKFRGESDRKESLYSSDYKAIAELQTIAQKKSVGIVIVHHTNKTDAKDEFHKVSGTQGLMGAADTTWLLERGRCETEGRLLITGRDVNEMNLHLTFDKDTCRWSTTGDMESCTPQQREVLVLLANAKSAMATKDIAEALKISKQAACNRLSRLVSMNKVEKTQYGSYMVVPSDT